jgi:hypothetical protein
MCLMTEQLCFLCKGGFLHFEGGFKNRSESSVSESCQLNAVYNTITLLSLTIMGHEVNLNDVYKHTAYSVHERTLK